MRPGRSSRLPMQADTSLRLFLALTLPEEVREEIARFTRAFERSTTGPRFVASDSLHVTLAFLGERPAEEPSRIAAALAAVWPRHAAFTLTLGRTGCFPHPEAPRVLWIAIERGQAL